MNKKIQVKIDNTRYSLDEIRKNYDRKEFRIPKYQRGYVWDSARRGKLIDSLLRGYPIGSIIIWRNEDIKYILDGQQRTRSLLKIREYPFKDMSEHTFESLFQSEQFIEQNKVLLTKILSTLKTKKIEELYVDPYNEEQEDHIKKLISKNKTAAEISGVDQKEIIRILKRYVAKLYEGNHFEIPSIDILESSEEDAIEIFDRLNSQGIELTRMEKLAARWSSTIVKIQDAELLELIKNIYRNDDSEDIRDTQINTPSEIVWAILLNSFKHTKFFKELFVNTVNGIEILNYSHIDKLLWLFRVAIAHYKNIDLSIALDDSFEADINLGKELAHIANNDEEWIKNTAHLMAEAWNKIEQLCPILMKEHNGKYIFINSASTNLFVSMASQILYRLLENDNATFNDNLQLVLFKEIINGSYESSTNKVVRSKIIEEEYMKDIDIKDVEVKLREVNKLQQEEITANKGFNNIAKLVINIAFSQYSNYKIERYDYDHVFPKNWLKKQDLSRGQNSIGNCGLLDASKNREKQDSVSTEELLSDKLTTFKEFMEVEDYKQMITDIKLHKERKDFDKFMDKRFEFILGKFMENINPISK